MFIFLKILSSRKYSRSYYNSNSGFISILISSSNPPTAIVYSQNRVSTVSCTGHHLFKFDASAFSATPQWALESSEASCILAGVVYGRGETKLYAYGLQNNLLNLYHFEEANGSFIFGYAFTNYVSIVNSNQVKYLMSGTYDVVVFTNLYNGAYL